MDSGVFTMQDATKVTTPISDDRNAWKFGFTAQAELWNGRLAMIGFVSAVLIELFAGEGVLRFWGLI
jgi:hypothetical protein